MTREYRRFRCIHCGWEETRQQDNAPRCCQDTPMLRVDRDSVPLHVIDAADWPEPDTGFSKLGEL